MEKHTTCGMLGAKKTARHVAMAMVAFCCIATETTKNTINGMLLGEKTNPFGHWLPGEKKSIWPLPCQKSVQ